MTGTRAVNLPTCVDTTPRSSERMAIEPARGALRAPRSARSRRRAHGGPSPPQRGTWSGHGRRMRHAQSLSVVFQVSCIETALLLHFVKCQLCRGTLSSVNIFGAFKKVLHSSKAEPLWPPHTPHPRAQVPAVLAPQASPTPRSQEEVQFSYEVPGHLLLLQVLQLLELRAQHLLDALEGLDVIPAENEPSKPGRRGP